jgi:glycosyltransferase involved in cell wall biosynthesis
MTLPATLASLRRQSEADWEAIVVCAGSVDDTAEIARYQQRADPRIRAVEVPLCTVGAARNIGAAMSRAPVLCFLDADDRWTDQTLERQLARLNELPNAAAVFGDCLIISADGTRRFTLSTAVPQPVEPSLVDLVRCRPVPTSTVAIRAKVFGRLGGFLETVESCEDYDLWYRLLVGGERIVSCVDVLAHIYVRPNGLSADLARYRRSMAVVLRRLLRDERLSEEALPLVRTELGGLADAMYPEHEVPLRAGE